MTTEAIQTVEPSDPWADFDRAFEEGPTRIFDAIVQSAFPSWTAPLWSRRSLGLRVPRTDVTDTGASYKIVAEVPGIPKEKIDIRIRGTSVEIRGETITEAEPKDGELVYRERSAATFYRHLELPEEIVASGAKAKVENGLLTLELPKQAPTPSPAELRVPVE